MRDIFIRSTEYNLWANHRVCNDFIKPLESALLDKELPSSFPTIRKTLYHIWDAETIWYDRLTGGAMTTLPIHHEGLSYSEFSGKMLDVSTRFKELVAQADDSFFKGEIKYKNSAGLEFTTGVPDVLFHVMNHSTYHRGQLITMLRTAGFMSVTSTDFITWTRIQKQV